MPNFPDLQIMYEIPIIIMKITSNSYFVLFSKFYQELNYFIKS